MARQESSKHPIINGSLWGAAIGGIGSAIIFNYLDDIASFGSPSSAYDKFFSAGTKTIVVATVVGAAIGALASAKNNKSWADTVESEKPTPLSR